MRHNNSSLILTSGVAFRAGRSGGERGIRTLDGVAPKPHFQLDPEEGSEGFLGSPEVRCRCFEES